MIEGKIVEALDSLKLDTCFVMDSATGEKYTYAQCFGLAKYISIRLMKLKSDSFAVILENGYPLLALYFAAMFANITIIPIDPQKGEQEIQDILNNHAGIPIICDNKELNGDYQIYPSEEIFPKDMRHDLYKEIVWQDVDFEKVYMITYTSGSTGKAKGVKHSLKNLFWSALSFGKKMCYGENTVMCHTMPMTYMAGVLNTIIMPFIMHSRVVLFPRFQVISAVHFWKRVEEYKVNTFWLSPTMLNILLTIDKKGDIKEYFSHNKPMFHVGTAPLYAELKAVFEERYQVKLYQSYGLSETLLLTTMPIDVGAVDNSVGELLEEVTLQFADDGEIFIDVPWMFLGYSNEKEEEYFSGNYYVSGDFGEMNKNYLMITGRKKDLIVRGGMNISPTQIEKEIYQYSEIQECCVSGVVINGEERTICWYVSGSSDHEKLEHQINTHLTNLLGTNYKIDYFKRVKSIAKNLNGKVDKTEMKKRLLEDKQNDYKV